jgi:hypothetical protein
MEATERERESERERERARERETGSEGKRAREQESEKVRERAREAVTNSVGMQVVSSARHRCSELQVSSTRGCDQHVLRMRAAVGAGLQR